MSCHRLNPSSHLLSLCVLGLLSFVSVANAQDVKTARSAYVSTAAGESHASSI